MTMKPLKPVYDAMSAERNAVPSVAVMVTLTPSHHWCQDSSLLWPSKKHQQWNITKKSSHAPPVVGLAAHPKVK
jgi:hypothetical protein